MVIVAGCGGGGGNGGGNNGGSGGNPTDSTAVVVIPNNPGRLQNVYLTGQGRAAGDLVAVIHRVSVDDQFGETATQLEEDVRLQLNGYTHQVIGLDIPTSVTRSYDHYNLEIQRLGVDDGAGGYTYYPDQSVSQPLVSATGANAFNAYFRVFPGRTSSVTVRLDDSMFNFDTQSFSYVFDRNQFILSNYSQFGTAPARMNGFLSDYVAFDISNLQDTRPDFPDMSGQATMLYINGDNFALGTKPDGPPENATPDPKPFFVLTPVGYVQGQHVGPRSAGGSPIPGTYTLVQGDPRPPEDPAATITALQGTYVNSTKYIASLGQNPQGFEIIAFPSTFTDDPSADDFGKMDIVLFNLSGGQITHMYFGQMDFLNDTISAFPIDQINDPSNVSNEITGSISSFVNSTGGSTSDVDSIRAGRYTLDATNLPSTFSTSGRFIVYRR